LNAWARSSSEPVERAVELFQTQIGQHVRPTLVTYNTLILAFSNRGQAEDAKNILDFLLEQGGDIRPDTISFNSVLYAYAVNGDGIQAESLLKEMMQRAANGNVHVKADTISFNTVLHAYRNDPQRAQNLVSHMETLYEAGNEDVEPDVYSYTR
jgi:pentatricopeptide repeat protein